MDLHKVSRPRFLGTIFWAIASCIAIVGVVAVLARATLNLSAAVTDKPDIGIYLLLPDEEIRESTLLRETELQRDYLIQTPEGQKLVILKKGEEEWFVADVDELHE